MSLVEIPDYGGDVIHQIVHYEDNTLPTFGLPLEQAVKNYNKVPDMPIRDDDVLLITPVKSGTHWSYELLSMLLSGKVENTPGTKMDTMIEFANQDDLDATPSPRVLNSHLQFNRLPKQVQDGACKIVLFLRNPKDMFTSNYNHHKGVHIFNYQGQWQNYLPLQLEGKLEYGNWFDTIRDWDKLLEDHPDRIMLVYYEDMKQYGLREMERISKFLRLSRDEAFLQAVVEKCSFENMKKDKAYTGPIKELLLRPDFSFFRKGEVGDWQNYFTVAQNKQFDELYNRKMMGCKIKFRFTLDQD